MADYKINDSELTSIANAIRAKGGTSAQLEFPEEFVSAIEDISSSGGIGSYTRGILVGEYDNGSPSTGGVGGRWTSTGYDTSDDIGFIVDYYYNDNLIKTTLMLKDNVLPSGALNRYFENFGTELASNGGYIQPSGFNVKIENNIMLVSFGGVGSKDYSAKVYTAVHSGGGGTNILYGSEEPLSAQGDNGDIYLQTVSEMNTDLPSGYQELPAIEGTGTQYIDTSISTAQAGLSVKAKLAITGINNATHSGGDGIWGGSWATNGYLMIRYGGVPSVFRYHYGGAVTRDVPVTLNKWTSLETNDTGMIIDGVTYPFTGGGVNSQGTLSLFFVGSHANGSPSKMRLGRTKVSVENTILADFVPCKNSNNEVGMYDLIGQAFYGNAGSGSFLAVTENTIMSSFLKVNGAWQQLINSDIDDVDTGSGSATPSLPYSDSSKILASAYPGNYSDDNPTWGGLEVIKSNIGLIKNSDFIYLRDNSFAKIDLGEPNHSFVAYFVGLVLSGNQWPVAIGTLYENSLNNSIALCSNSEKICYTHFGNTIAQTSLSSIKTFVGALRIDGTNKLSSCFVNGEQIAQPSSFNNSGQYCSFGAFSNSTYFANLFIKYLAVVDGVENDSTIISNQQHLMNLYGIE